MWYSKKIKHEAQGLNKNMITEENSKCLPQCIEQNGKWEISKGSRMAKGQESETNTLNSFSVPSTGCIFRADAVMSSLWSTVLSGCSGPLPTASDYVYLPEDSFPLSPTPITVEIWITNTLLESSSTNDSQKLIYKYPISLKSCWIILSWGFYTVS